MEAPLNVKRINEFAGFASNRDPHDSPEVAVSGKNMRTHIPGLLSARKGCKPVTYSNADTATTNDAIAAIGVRNEIGDMVIYEDSAGNLVVGKGAS